MNYTVGSIATRLRRAGKWRTRDEKMNSLRHIAFAVGRHYLSGNLLYGCFDLRFACHVSTENISHDRIGLCAFCHARPTQGEVSHGTRGRYSLAGNHKRTRQPYLQRQHRAKRTYSTVSIDDVQDGNYLLLVNDACHALNQRGTARYTLSRRRAFPGNYRRARRAGYSSTDGAERYHLQMSRCTRV